MQLLLPILIFAGLASNVSQDAFGMLRQLSFCDIPAFASSENNGGPFCCNDPMNNLVMLEFSYIPAICWRIYSGYLPEFALKSTAPRISGNRLSLSEVESIRT